MYNQKEMAKERQHEDEEEISPELDKRKATVYKIKRMDKEDGRVRHIAVGGVSSSKTQEI